jgi:hypothetical protein
MTKVKEEEEVQESSLENFDWDDTGAGDFFGIADTAAEVVKPVKKEEPKKEAKKEEEETQEEVEETSDDDSFFGVAPEKGEDEDEEEEEESEEENDDYFTSLTSTMKEKGIFQNIEIPEDEEITEEKFIEFQDEEIEARVEEALDGFMEELGGDAKEFLAHVKEGGKPEDFFKVYSQDRGIPKGDILDEKYQEKVARYYYKNIEEWDSEDIDDRIEWLKDSAKLGKEADKHIQRIEKLDEKAKEDLQKQTLAQQKQAEKSRKAFVDTVKETLDKTDEIDNYKFNPKVKSKLHSFITKPSVKVSKNKYVTQMQSKLQEALKSPEKMIVLADILMSDFDFSNVATASTTKTTKKLRKDIQRSKTVRPKGSGKFKKGRNLADYF